MVRRPPLIAVVDDEASVRRALGRLLQSSGFAVESFASGVEFLAGLPEASPDCLVLDLHMPDMDGFAVLAAIEDPPLGVPVVIITGHDTAEARRRAEGAKVSAYLCKPVDEQLLLDAIQTSMEKQ